MFGIGEPSAPRTLQELVSAFERKGAPALDGLRGRPVLIQCDRAKEGDAWGFETRTVAAPWDIRVALALARNGRVAAPELLAKAGPVYAVSKRPGGPFPDRIGVGRARTADISLRHSSVSKYHAYFAWDEGRRGWMVWDARSRNGTMVGERRLEPGEGAPVESGTSVIFGENMFLFFAEAGFRKLVESLAQTAPSMVR